MFFLKLSFNFITLILVIKISTSKSSISGDGEGGLKFGYKGKTYSFATRTCPGGIFFKKPLKLDYICPNGYFLKRSNGCSNKLESIVGADKFVCSDVGKNERKVQALIPVTNAEYPTSHTIAFFDDPVYLTKFRRYTVESAIRNHLYIPKEKGSGNLIVSNPRHTPQMQIGNLCYSGVSQRDGSAYKLKVNEPYDPKNNVNENTFFKKGCNNFSQPVNFDNSEQFHLNVGKTDYKRFARAIEAHPMRSVESLEEEFNDLMAFVRRRKNIDGDNGEEQVFLDLLKKDIFEDKVGVLEPIDEQNEDIIKGTTHSPKHEDVATATEKNDADFHGQGEEGNGDEHEGVASDEGAHIADQEQEHDDDGSEHQSDHVDTDSHVEEPKPQSHHDASNHQIKEPEPQSDQGESEHQVEKSEHHKSDHVPKPEHHQAVGPKKSVYVNIHHGEDQDQSDHGKVEIKKVDHKESDADNHKNNVPVTDEGTNNTEGDSKEGDEEKNTEEDKNAENEITHDQNDEKPFEDAMTTEVPKEDDAENHEKQEEVVETPEHDESEKHEAQEDQPVMTVEDEIEKEMAKEDENLLNNRIARDDTGVPLQVTDLKEEVTFNYAKMGLSQYVLEIISLARQSIAELAGDVTESGEEIPTEVFFMETFVPSYQTEWYKMLNATINVMVEILPAESFPPELLREALKVFTYFGRTVNTGHAAEKKFLQDEKEIKNTISALESCANGEGKPDYEINEEKCPPQLSNFSISGVLWHDETLDYEDDVSFNVTDVMQMGGSVFGGRVFRRSAHLIVELMYTAFDTVFSHCFKEFKAINDLNAHARYGYYISSIFKNEEIYTRWTEVEPLHESVYLSLLPSWNGRHFKDLTLELDALRLGVKRRSVPSGYIDPRVAKKRSVEAMDPMAPQASLTTGIGLCPCGTDFILRKCKRCDRAPFNNVNGELGEQDDTEKQISSYEMNLKKLILRRGNAGRRVRTFHRENSWRKKEWVRRRRRRSITNSQKNVPSPTISKTGKNKSSNSGLKSREIWNGLAYCLDISITENSDGQIQHLGLEPPLKTFKTETFC